MNRFVRFAELALFFAVGVVPIQARILEPGPDYRLVEKADAVVLVDPATIKLAEQPEGIDPLAKWTMTAGPSLQGGVKGTVRITEGLREIPKAAKSLLVFLKKDGAGNYEAVNSTATYIPTSLTAEELAKLPGWGWKKGGETAALALLFAVETDGECALAQAGMLATAPGPLPKHPSIQRVNDGSKRELAQVLVGLYAQGIGALTFPEGVPDLSKLRQDGSWPNRAGLAQAYIRIWYKRQPRDSRDREAMTTFALAQRGEFQADLLGAMEHSFPRDKISPIAELMNTSETAAVQYACFKILSCTLNNGKGIIGYDVFRKDKKKYLALANAYIRKE